MARRSFLTALILASLAVPVASAGAAPRVAVEPSSPSFRDGFQTSMQLPRTAKIAADGGTVPGQVPATVGLDLLLGPSVPDLVLSAHLKSAKPLRTNDLMAKIASTTSASTSLRTLRDNVLRIANAYMAAPTLEDKGNNNRSNLICALGTDVSCKQKWPWCAIFASSMWRMAGIKAMPLLPPVSGIVAWGKLHNRWRDLSSKANKGFVPAAGDIVAFGCGKDRKWCTHTGLVVGIESVTSGKTTTRYLRTIEGNTSTTVKDKDGKIREGVATKLRALDSWISGYISLS